MIIDNHKNIVIYCEQKHPNKFKTNKDISNAINQEIDVAKAVNALIYVVMMEIDLFGLTQILVILY